MNDHDNEQIIEEEIKKRFGNPPKYKISDAKRKEFVARLYKTSEERKHIVELPIIAKALSFQGVSVMVATVLLVAGFNYFFMPIYPAVSDIKGTVKIYRASKNEWIFPDKSNMRLAENDILKTFSDGQADLVVPNLYHIRLKNNSEIKLASAISRTVPRNISYVLNQGKVFTHYNKYRRMGKELVIETPQAVASALGTDFMVASTPIIDRTMVGVLDGTVRVSTLGLAKEDMGPVLVRAGERTTVKKGLLPSKPARLMEDDLLEMEELYNIGTRPQVALMISTGPTRTRELLSAMHLYISSDKPGILAEKFEPIARRINQAIKEKSKEKHIESITSLEEIVNNYPNPKYDIQFLLFIGAYYDYIGEDQKAIATMERVVRDYSRSPLASIAQCAIGIIYEEELKDLTKAKDAYKKVISDYPNSPEAEEASAGLNRLI